MNVDVSTITAPCSFTLTSSSTPLLITEVRVYDYTGNLKRIVKVGGSKHASINVSGFGSGSYYLEITANNSYKEKQTLIIQK